MASIGPASEKQKEIFALFDQLGDLRKELKTAMDRAGSISSVLSRMEDRLKPEVVEEIDAAGTGTTGRRKRSTNLDTSAEEVKAVSKKAAEPPVKEPGKRYCGKCGFGGHRRTTCPN